MNYKTGLSDSLIKQFIRTYDAHYSVIFSSVYSRVNNYHYAEDICQEVFIRLYDKIEEVENPRKWLFGCLRIVVIDFYKRKYSRDIDIEELFDDIGMSYVNGFRDTRIMIKDVLDAVTDEEDGESVSLFELVAVYNYSLADAARHTGLSYKQARYRYNRITQKLAAGLKNKGINSIEDLL